MVQTVRASRPFFDPLLRAIEIGGRARVGALRAKGDEGV